MVAESPPSPPPATLRWLYAGQGSMGAAALEVLLDGLDTELWPLAVFSGEPPWGVRPVGSVAEARGLDLHHVETIGADPRAHWPEVFSSLDVAVVGCWTERIPRTALDVPVHGWLNLHPSALPAWRGLDPVAWQLLTCPGDIGCTVHHITEGQDDGAVVAQGTVPVHDGDDREVLLVRSGARLGQLAAGYLRALAAGSAGPAVPQDPAAATWCPPGGVVPMLDPSVLRARVAARVARAFSPHPGVAIATMPGDQRFAVTAVGEGLSADDQPGAIVTVDADPEANVAVACRDRWLLGRTWAVGAERPTVTSLGLSDPGDPTEST